MPTRTDRERLLDILDAVQRIRAYCDTVSYEGFLDDPMRRDAVERQFIRLGEAASRVGADFCETHPELDWDDMRAMRNFVVHVYWGVSADILWKTAKDDLPPLEPKILAAIAATR